MPSKLTHSSTSNRCRRLVIGGLTLLALIGASSVHGVVVDGEKKPDLSAARHQSNESALIDPSNSEICGAYDSNSREHEFVNMARAGQFPWLVSFQIKVPHDMSEAEQEKASNESVHDTKKRTKGVVDDQHFCSGSFIDEKWIVSAAHCFSKDTIQNYLSLGKLKGVAGSEYVSSRHPNNVNLTISRIYIHSKYDLSMPVGFDIALVELAHPITFAQKRHSNRLGDQDSPFMNSICLPKKGLKPKVNGSVRIAGWGLSKDQDESSMPSKLLTTDILLSNIDECAEKYVKALKSEKPRAQAKDVDDLLCASYKNTRDACQSDSGAPLIEYANNRATAVGIVSYGVGCASKGVPGLYTRVSAYNDWIEDIKKHGSGASVFFKVLKSNFAGDVDSPSGGSTVAPKGALVMTAKPTHTGANNSDQTGGSTGRPPVSKSVGPGVPASGSAISGIRASSRPSLAPIPSTSTTGAPSFKFFDE